MAEFVLAIDLGQTRDFTAAVVAEVDRASGDPQLAVRHLERFELSTPYPRQVERIRALHDAVRHVDGAGRSRGAVRLVVDQTGVGRAVVDLLREHLDVTAVTITAGDNEARVGHRDVHVPKRDLVSGLVVAVQTARVRVAASAPLARELVDELLGFRMSVSERGYARFGNDVGDGWRQSAHDDLVLATALAVWQADRGYASLTWGQS